MFNCWLLLSSCWFSSPGPYFVAKFLLSSFVINLLRKNDKLMVPSLARQRLLIVVFGSSPDQLKEKKSCQSWTPSDKTFWICACMSIVGSHWLVKPIIYHNTFLVSVHMCRLVLYNEFKKDPVLTQNAVTF